MIISPLNYPGNKAKAIAEIAKFLPTKIDLFVDAFCGSAIVAFNSKADKVICNDVDSHVISLLKYMDKNGYKKIYKHMNHIIKKYGFTDTTNKFNRYVEKKHEGLSKYNKKPYDALKSDYNKTKNVNLLFALVIFGFNHLIRFNSNGDFNVPVGKVDYSKSLRDKTKDFCIAMKNYKIKYSTLSFNNKKLYQHCTKKSLVYFDPPYLITNAPYNSKWCSNNDKNLFKLFDYLTNKGIKAAMSNVFESNGKVNIQLIKWAKKYNIHFLKRQYRNANYQKKNISDSIEVLITNY